jgi:hypothetical protein
MYFLRNARRIPPVIPYASNIENNGDLNEGSLKTKIKAKNEKKRIIENIGLNREYSFNL